MAINNRRTFLKQSALGLLTAGWVKPVVAATYNQQERPFSRQVIHLWPDGSVHNGSDSNARPQMELFLPELQGTGPLAVVLVCPGGGYKGLSGLEGVPFAKLFAAAGIAAAVLRYRVYPNQYPAAYADACRAMRLLRAQAGTWKLDPDRIGILGFSAGGHLASLVATRPNLYKDAEDNLVDRYTCRPDRVMLGYPVISMLEYAHGGSKFYLLGKAPPHDLLVQLSTQMQVNKDTPPAFLFHMQDDHVVPVQNSLLFSEACIKNKVPVALHIYPRGGHGVAMAAQNPDLSQWTSILLTWLKGEGW